MNIESKVKIDLRELTKAQLIALCTQRKVLPLSIAVGMLKAELVASLEAANYAEKAHATEQ